MGQSRLGPHSARAAGTHWSDFSSNAIRRASTWPKPRPSSAQAESESKAEAEQRQQQEREAYARGWVGSKQALLDHVKQNHPVFMDPQKSDSEWAKIAGTLKSVGMPEEVVQAAFGVRHDPNVPLVSPPMFELIRKAALYDAAVQQHSKVTAPGKPAERRPQARSAWSRPRRPGSVHHRRTRRRWAGPRHSSTAPFRFKDAKAVELAKLTARRSG